MRAVAWIELMEDLSGWHDQMNANSLLGNKLSSKPNYFNNNNEGWIDVSNLNQIKPLLKEIGNNMCHIFMLTILQLNLVKILLS